MGIIKFRIMVGHAQMACNLAQVLWMIEKAEKKGGSGTVGETKNSLTYYP